MACSSNLSCKEAQSSNWKQSPPTTLKPTSVSLCLQARVHAQKLLQLLKTAPPDGDQVSEYEPVGDIFHANQKHCSREYDPFPNKDMDILTETSESCYLVSGSVLVRFLLL